MDLWAGRSPQRGHTPASYPSWQSPPAINGSKLKYICDAILQRIQLNAIVRVKLLNMDPIS